MMPPITDAFAEQGPHELTIRRLFPQAFAWTGSSPVFSKPLYILAFTNRSGSNLLVDYLRQTGKFRGFGEGLNGDEVERNIRRDPIDSFPDYIARLAGARNEPGFWGIKASWDQIILLHRANIPAMFTGVRLIHSVRADLLGQAVSHWIAHQTNQWMSTQKKTDVTPQFSAKHIEQILMSNVRSNTFIDLIARTRGIPRHVVVYEQLQRDPADVMARLSKALSVDLGDWEPKPPRISRQRDETNDAFGMACQDAWRSKLLP